MTSLSIKRAWLRATGMALAATLAATPLAAQERAVEFKPNPAETKQFGALAEGPYKRLVLRNVNVIPGNGGPARGPFDILITGNVIKEMRRYYPHAADGEANRLTGDRIIEGEGRYVMPGMINLHLHLREEELPLDYINYLQLATGVTSVGPAEQERVQGLLDAIADNDILAPRMFPIYMWGSLTDFTKEELADPAMAPQVAKAMAAKGIRQVYLNQQSWDRDLFGAAAKAVAANGGITGLHVQPANTAQVNAIEAARLGVSMIVHHYGYAESALDRTVQDYPRDYNFFDENKRFREAGRVWEEVGRNPETRKKLLEDIAQELVDLGVVMQPNRATYEANRDVVRAYGLPWHEKYTHQQLWEWHLPNPDNHAAFQHDWTSQDEATWYYVYKLWGDLIYEFNKRGGTVAYGTDDNFQISTGGFGNIRELQLMLEAGMHPLEAIEAATFNSAKIIKEPKLGLVQEGYIADLLLVDGNPAENFRYLYPFGAINMAEDRSMYRTKGIVHTIKDGIVINNEAMMEEVARIVKESKVGAQPDVVTEPFVVE